MLVGAAAGLPGTYTGIHITEHPGPLAPGRWTVGHLRKRGCSAPARQLRRSNCPRYFPSHEPHETVLGGKGERTHFRSGCENLGLADELGAFHEKGAALLPWILRSSKEFPSVWSIGCVVGRHCCPPQPCHRPLLPPVWRRAGTWMGPHSAPVARWTILKAGYLAVPI